MYQDVMVHQSEEAANAKSQEKSREEKSSEKESCEKGTLRRKDQGREKVQTYGCSAVEVLPSALQKKEKIAV